MSRGRVQPMRGLFGLLVKEPPIQEHGTCLLVATADPTLAKDVFQKIRCRFPHLQLTVVAPHSFRPLFPEQTVFLTNREVKTRLRLWTIYLRRKRFDIAVFILNGSPTFRLPKLWTFVLNARSVIAYNENLDSFSFHRNHWRTIYQQCRWRLTNSRLMPVQVLDRSLLLVGIPILLARTALLVLRRNFQSNNR